jgi:hypothetical protein
LTEAQLSMLCTSECKSSLIKVRSDVAQSCTGTNDTISYWNGRILSSTPTICPAGRISKCPISFQSFSTDCASIRSSGKFCDRIAVGLGDSTWTSQQSCSDCMLGMQQFQLNSPFGYDEDYASDFQSLTSRCNATGYS